MEETRKGLTINNRFTLQEYKGSGTFGEVWRATDTQKKKDIAIKIYISLNRQGCDEFLEEYKIASGLTHKNLLVTEQYDVWQSRPYLTMKYCAKGSAANLVGKLKPTMENERLLWAFIRDVSAGLTYLHNLEPDPIVHQDIKPDNVLMDSNGSFMITDFGISKKVRNTLRSQSKRAVEAGATAYMGPERFSKQPAPILASDIWSLGASIYELAEGELPFSGMGGIMLKNAAEMPDLNGWSDDLNNIMHRCLEKEPWKRIKAHEIEQIARERVAYYDDHLREYPGSTKYEPRATQRQTSSSSSLTNGTVKKEPTKPETPRKESPKPDNSHKGVWYSLAAIAACIVIYFGFFHESPELKDAKLNNESYTTLVTQCSQDIEQGDGNNTQANGHSARINIKQNGKKTTGPSAQVNSITVDHNQTLDDGKGMIIHVKFDVQNMKGKNGRVVAYFYDNDGNALIDTNDRYHTLGTPSKVSTGKDITPGYDNTSYSDLTLTIPYSELHQTGSAARTLKFKISIWDKSVSPSNEFFSGSSWTTFTFTPGTEASLTVDGSTSDKTKHFSESGGRETYYVKTSASSYETWGVPSWCSIENQTSSSFTLVCNRNTSTSSRSDYMKVKAAGKEIRIDITQDASSGPSAKIVSVSQEHNVSNGFSRGMNIKLKFETSGMLNKRVTATAWFYYGDNTTKLNNGFGGQVNVSKSDTAPYEETTFTMTLFLPYTNLRMMGGGSTMLSFDVVLTDSSGKTLARDENNSFTYSQAW